jgi:hypothetical protein
LKGKSDYYIEHGMERKMPENYYQKCRITTAKQTMVN